MISETGQPAYGSAAEYREDLEGFLGVMDMFFREYAYLGKVLVNYGTHTYQFVDETGMGMSEGAKRSVDRMLDEGLPVAFYGLNEGDVEYIGELMEECAGIIMDGLTYTDILWEYEKGYRTGVGLWNHMGRMLSCAGNCEHKEMWDAQRAELFRALGKMSSAVARYAQEMDFSCNDMAMPEHVGHEMTEVAFQMCEGSFSNASRFMYLCREFMIGADADGYFHNMIDIGLKTVKLKEWLDVLRMEPAEGRLKEYIKYMRAYRNLYPECLIALREDILQARDVIGDILKASEDSGLEKGIEKATELVDEVIG